MNISFKHCNLVDLEQLVKISKETFIDAFEKDNNPRDFKIYVNSAFNTSQIKREILNPNSQFYIGFHNDVLAGYFKINEKEAQDEPYGDEAMELSRIYVLSEFQGQGMGYLFLKKICALAKAKSKSYLWLGVWERNTEAIRFYERHGFKKIGTHSFYIGKDKQTDWLMRLNLV